MPVQRGGVRRGRRANQQQPQVNNVNNNINQIPIVEAGIATRTRRRRAAAAAAAAAAVPVNDNVGGLPPAAAVAAELVVAGKEEAIPAEKREEVGDKLMVMNDQGSGGKSPDKGQAADDDANAAPLPERVSLSNSHQCSHDAA